MERAEDVVKLGDTIRVYVVGYEGEEGALRLSKRRADEQEAWARLEAFLEDGTVIEAPVTDVVKGGLVVDVGLRGFVPASHVGRGFVMKYTGRGNHEATTGGSNPLTWLQITTTGPVLGIASIPTIWILKYQVKIGLKTH